MKDIRLEFSQMIGRVYSILMEPNLYDKEKIAEELMDIMKRVIRIPQDEITCKHSRDEKSTHHEPLNEYYISSGHDYWTIIGHRFLIDAEDFLFIFRKHSDTTETCEALFKNWDNILINRNSKKNEN